MERRAVVANGTVQGVGFRPFVCQTARSLGLAGFVRNAAGEVRIEVEGTAATLDEFCGKLLADAPVLASIDRLSSQVIEARGEQGFRIETSSLHGSGEITITPDAAPCNACLAELFDPRDRRYLYPFLNCTNCGPRLTIITAAPYDRARTTMQSFTMCVDCQAEYNDPANRRFHAQPIACPRCGPQLRLCDAEGQTAVTQEPLADFVTALAHGQIGALKGLGGYHLVCDATSEQAVATLRARKGRDDKPFAIMVDSIAQAALYCEVTVQECELLASSRRPIVLLRRRPAAQTALATSVAPNNLYVGLMLPYTPLHHLLLRGVAGKPLVMTSGNRSDEPIAYREPDAFEQLRGIADLFLTHDREIHVRCDDSVTRIVAGSESLVRRSRGYAPQPLRLPIETPLPLLAVGGQLKGTFGLGSHAQAVVSHHLGDLDHVEATRAFVQDVALYEDLFQVRPAAIVCDIHPDYASTRYARQRAVREGLHCLRVQHHHAHVASCMAEHEILEPVIGIAFDGTGWGPDGAIWGGEFLLADYVGYTRAAHLRYVPLPGGDRAAREPWRMGAAYLLDAGCDLAAIERWTRRANLRLIRQMIERRINSPLTSSAGRLFDAIAAIVGLRGVTSFEAQAAMELEWSARDAAPGLGYPFEIRYGQIAVAPATVAPWEIDLRPMIRAVHLDVRNRKPRSHIARRFHATLVHVIAATCERLRETSGRQIVVLSGGVFSNVLLTEECVARLEADGFRVLRHTRVPANDGGLSLGQLAIGAAVLSGEQDYESVTRPTAAREMRSRPAARRVLRDCRNHDVKPQK